MKRFGLLLLAAASICVAMGAAGSTRPHYGGTLRLAVQEAPINLDPAVFNQVDSTVLRSLSRLIFDTLVTVDDRGQPLPALASSWQVEPGNQRWQFSVRRGATFQDGSAVSPDVVAASLRNVNAAWKVFASAESVVVECNASTPNLPAILALTRYGIAKRAGDKVIGSGPFAIGGWDPGKRLTLTARDEYWGGRSFVDRIEIQMGVGFREQMIQFDLGKADVIEVAPEQARHAASDRRRVEDSSPAELMAIVFTHEARSAEDTKLRQALELSIDRESMNSVLLQGGGEPAGTLLPAWMTGYAFLFPTAADMQRAQLLRGEVPQAPAWNMGYDTSDPMARVIAERIALNARDAGLRLQAGNTAPADMRLLRVPLASLDARVALVSFAARLGLTPPRFNDDTTGSIYLAENAALQSQRIIPLLHLRNATALGTTVRGWTESRDGEWQLQNLWLATEKP
jgi:ABC-type oligopeptide transport system substrate-binding subunit